MSEPHLVIPGPRSIDNSKNHIKNWYAKTESCAFLHCQFNVVNKILFYESYEFLQQNTADL